MAFHSTGGEEDPNRRSSLLVQDLGFFSASSQRDRSFHEEEAGHLLIAAQTPQSEPITPTRSNSIQDTCSANYLGSLESRIQLEYLSSSAELETSSSSPEEESSTEEDDRYNNMSRRIASEEKQRSKYTILSKAGIVHPHNFDTASLKPGHVFTVVDSTAAQIAERTLVVMRKTASQCSSPCLQCLTLCHHGAYFEDSSHRKVEVEVDGQPASDSRQVSIKLKLDKNKSDLDLRPDSWINCDEIYSIHEVDFRWDGVVTNFDELFKVFREVQKKALSAGQPP